MNDLIYYDSIDLINQDKWRHFYKNHPKNNAFQSFEMYGFWNCLVNYKPFVFMAENSKGECLAFCTGVVAPVGKSKTKYHDKTALIYGGPLFLHNDNGLYDAFILKLGAFLKRISRFTEFRNLGRDPYLKDNFTKHKWEYIPKVNYLIQLDTEELVFSRFSRNKRREIRSSLKKGVEISYDKTEENIEVIYSILEKIYIRNDKKLTLPIPDLNFFIQLMKLEFTGLNMVSFEGKVIGGGFFLFDETYLYGWFRGSLNADFGFLDPDSVLDWSVMQFGLKKGISFFDYMGAGRKGWENNIRKYKSRFGGELVENGMYSRASNPLLFRIQNKFRRMIA
ncbi:GNAT family N-acetyltransferase [Lutimonas halocynthiae]|uniref:GNAT family N-acetyltransferase n=1 Tax=Lutimonas halocynthiae TaxID=1446477 RepID=UPI0025B4F3FD|nr:GNAT family N-acetyltransferase [Lutimonas halocynthiae]MDN3644277.1 GNAT family N-acetyltransferase [Lutimonas halocynthiae]